MFPFVGLIKSSLSFVMFVAHTYTELPFTLFSQPLFPALIFCTKKRTELPKALTFQNKIIMLIPNRNHSLMQQKSQNQFKHTFVLCRGYIRSPYRRNTGLKWSVVPKQEVSG